MIFGWSHFLWKGLWNQQASLIRLALSFSRISVQAGNPSDPSTICLSLEGSCCHSFWSTWFCYYHEQQVGTPSDKHVCALHYWYAVAEYQLYPQTVGLHWGSSFIEKLLAGYLTSLIREREGNSCTRVVPVIWGSSPPFITVSSGTLTSPSLCFIHLVTPWVVISPSWPWG